MKNIISASVLGLGLLAGSQAASAATVPVLNWTTNIPAASANLTVEGDDVAATNILTGSVVFNTAVSGDNHSWEFTVTPDSVSNTFVTFLSALTSIATWTVDGNALTLVSAGQTQLMGAYLAAGTHILELGDITSLAGGHYDITVTATAATPVPAAVWLFGSGLAGLVASRRKKAGLAA